MPEQTTASRFTVVGDNERRLGDSNSVADDGVLWTAVGRWWVVAKWLTADGRSWGWRSGRWPSSGSGEGIKPERELLGNWDFGGFGLSGGWANE